MYSQTRYITRKKQNSSFRMLNATFAALPAEIMKNFSHRTQTGTTPPLRAPIAISHLRLANFVHFLWPLFPCLYLLSPSPFAPPSLSLLFLFRHPTIIFLPLDFPLSPSLSLPAPASFVTSLHTTNTHDTHQKQEQETTSTACCDNATQQAKQQPPSCLAVVPTIIKTLPFHSQ